MALTDLNKNFAARFTRANEGFSEAIRLNNEHLCSYYLGVLSGMLALILPEHEAHILLNVKGMGVNAINREVQPVLSQAHVILREANRG